MNQPSRPGRAVEAWLWVVYAMVFITVIVGGVTRLTGSGLSMVDWRPLMGSLPPMGEAEWQAVFAQYKRSPQYLEVNHWMGLADFKRIFFWEYLHRLIGRAIGLVVLVPGIWFLVRRRLRGRWAARVLLAFVFGGLQGLLGWYMVKSGLVDVPAVSHLRLAAHLSLAFFVGCWVLWIILDLRAPAERKGRPAIGRAAWAFMALLALQIVYGAFMAGLRAGYLYRTWPDMHGELWPTGAMALEPGWRNLVANPIMVNALHRALAWLVLVVGAWLAIAAWRRAVDHPQRRAAISVLISLAAQFALGVVTVVAAVPVWAGAAHQACAFLLLSATLWLAHTARHQGSSRISGPEPPARRDARGRRAG